VSANTAIARRAFRQVWIGAATWGLVFGATVAASALSYVGSFPTAASRRQLLATTSGDKGISIVLGPVSAIDSVGGYTVYKCFVFLTTIGAVWATLAATRLLRREEDSGRWELLLAGDTDAARATTASLSALGAAVAIVFFGTTLITMLAGRSSKVGFGVPETVLYGSSIAIAPAVFAAFGAFASQLGRTRRVATGLGMGFVGVAFVVRMIADSGSRARWLLWATPFGWTERVRPFTRNTPWPLLPAAATVLVLCSAAVVLASRRDIGEGVLASSEVSPPRPLGLRSPLGLAARLEAPVVVAWCVGVAAAGFSFGMIVKVTTGSVPASLTDTLQKFGVRGTFANQYFGVLFLLLASTIALIPAGLIGSAADEETSGRLFHVLVQPSNRTAFLLGRLVISAGAVATAGLLAGVAAWLGARTQGVHLDFTTMAGAGLNVVPTALVALGVGAVAFSIAPRRAAATAYAVVLWSLLVDLVGSLVRGLSWLDHASLFHYMALVPAQPAEARTVVITLVVAVVLCIVAAAVFERRDLQSA
jgi:ABC-2 type transport system permease protein